MSCFTFRRITIEDPEILLERALTSMHNYDYEDAMTFSEEALEIARSIEVKAIEGKALQQIGEICCSLGRYKSAKDHFKLALKMYREIGFCPGEGDVLYLLGELYGYLDQQESAMSYYKDSLEISRKVGERHLEGQALLRLGIVNSHLNQCEDTRTYSFYEGALEVSREIGDRDLEGRALYELGAFNICLGRWKLAKKFCEEAFEIIREGDDRLIESELRDWLHTIQNEEVEMKGEASSEVVGGFMNTLAKNMKLLLSIENLKLHKSIKNRHPSSSAKYTGGEKERRLFGCIYLNS